ncbi:FadR/GntR family transcriptional regulator [Streptosporangium sp. NPDC000509]|uniref:FadR/GntR family transcriptional regulator n=1 Tax=Streptosporangium sp. NPDC000509 TaxID=3366186 RepID=UPI00369F7997
METFGEPRALGQAVVRPRQQVEDRIRRAILDGELKRGERLPSETELARQFEVSRTTVREALRSLSTQNFIEKVPGAGGGSFVRAVDHEALSEMLSESMKNLLSLGSIGADEVQSVREYLEVPAVRLAAGHRSAEDLAQMHRIIERQKSVRVTDPSVPQLDVDFHSAVARASGNRVLGSFVQALHEQTMPVRFLDLSEQVGAETVLQHLQIVKAIEAGDEDAAQNAMVTHLRYLQAHRVAAAEHD